MSGLVNFRDFGGYPTQDGRKIKKGIFYRSGSYRDLSDEERDYIRSLNIQTLCDFREIEELDLPEHRETFAKDVYTISASAHLGMFDNNAEEKFEFTSKHMKTFYERLVFANPGYQNVFRVLQEDNAVPYLHNCTAGKDRTGVGTALVQLMLGVSEDLIMVDYMKSMNAIEEIFGNEKRRLAAGLDEESLYHKTVGLVVMPAYLETALNTIKEKYDTYDAYFEAEYGLDQATIAALRDRYTEAA